MTCDLGLLEADLRRDEGSRLQIYKDSLGNNTIGVGHLLRPDELSHYANGITEEEETTILRGDIVQAIAWLDREIPWWSGLPEPAARGLANACFQLRGKLLGFKMMLAALDHHDFEGAAINALDSLWAKQTPSRAERIAELFRSCAKAP